MRGRKKTDNAIPKPVSIDVHFKCKPSLHKLLSEKADQFTEGNLSRLLKIMIQKWPYAYEGDEVFEE